MGGTSVFEVSDHVDRQSFECSLGLEDGLEVEKCLGWVLVGTVACIHHWNGSNF